MPNLPVCHLTLTAAALLLAAASATTPLAAAPWQSCGELHAETYNLRELREDWIRRGKPLFDRKERPEQSSVLHGNTYSEWRDVGSGIEVEWVDGERVKGDARVHLVPGLHEVVITFHRAGLASVDALLVRVDFREGWEHVFEAEVDTLSAISHDVWSPVLQCRPLKGHEGQALSPAPADATAALQGALEDVAESAFGAQFEDAPVTPGRSLRLDEFKSEGGTGRWARHEAPPAGAPAAQVIGTPGGVKLGESLLFLVAVDGRKVDKGERGTRVAPGRHELGFTVGSDGRRVATIEVDLAAGQDCHARLVTLGEESEVRWRCRAEPTPR